MTGMVRKLSVAGVALVWLLVSGIASAEKLINDHEFLGDFTKKAAKLYSDGESTSLAKLREEMSREVTKLPKLPKPNKSWKKPTPAELYNKYVDATLLIGAIYNCGNCDKDHAETASGFIIHEDGIAVTNHHVFEGMTSEERDNRAMIVMDSKGNAYQITEVLATNEQDDLAIFRFDTNGKKMPAYSLADNYEVGMNVHVISNPRQMFFTYSSGIISRIYEHSQSKGKIVSITADYAAGSSGGPVFDDYGNIVSVVSSTRSIYYKPREQKSLQMVVKQTIPVSRIKALIES